MKTKLKIYAMLLVAFAAMLAMSLASCTPQQRLNRLLKKHPELVKHDTVFIEKTITIAEVKADTGKKVNTNVAGVDSIIQHYTQLLDSANANRLTTEIKNYIINRPCLEDTLRLDLKNGGYIKVFQENGEIKLKLFEPAQEIKIPCPTVVNSVTQTKDSFLDRAVFKWLWFVLAIVFFLLLLISFKRH